MASTPQAKIRFLVIFLVDCCHYWSLLVHCDEKYRSYPKKVQKISMSKNGVKTDLRPLFNELWATLGFSKTRGFTRVILTHKIYFDDTKMASNPQLKSDFGHYLSFCRSILRKKSILESSTLNPILIIFWLSFVFFGQFDEKNRS